MQSFIVKKQPKSFNSWRKMTNQKRKSYIETIQNSFKVYYSSHDALTEDLYGIIYYFFKQYRDNDADNISKPIWDCLTGCLFVDDKQVKMRTAGIFDLSKNDFNILDFTGIEGKVLTDLIDAFDTEDDVMYIECGNLNNSLFKFNLE